MCKGSAHLIFFGVPDKFIRCPKGFVARTAFWLVCAALAFGRQFTFYGLVTKAHALGYIYFELEHAGADMAKCLLIESSCVGHVFKWRFRGARTAMATFQAAPLWSIEPKPDF